MAVDDGILVKNSFGFQLAGVLVNDAVTENIGYAIHHRSKRAVITQLDKKRILHSKYAKNQS